jgi:predicted RNase H-like nuclease
MTDDEALFDDLSRRLREAHKRIATLETDDETKGVVVRRLIAITNASKHDLRRASDRLDALVADLDSGRYPIAEDD